MTWYVTVYVKITVLDSLDMLIDLQELIHTVNF